MCIYIYMYMYALYTYIYIERERDIYRERDTHVHEYMFACYIDVRTRALRINPAGHQVSLREGDLRRDDLRPRLSAARLYLSLSLSLSLPLSLYIYIYIYIYVYTYIYIYKSGVEWVEIISTHSTPH